MISLGICSKLKLTKKNNKQTKTSQGYISSICSGTTSRCSLLLMCSDTALALLIIALWCYDTAPCSSATASKSLVLLLCCSEKFCGALALLCAALPQLWGVLCCFIVLYCCFEALQYSGDLCKTFLLSSHWSIMGLSPH